MSSPWTRLSRQTPSKSAFWRYNWIAHHQIIAALERAAPYVRGRLLDVGCGTMPTRTWWAGRFTEYRGVDLADSPYLGDARLTAIARAEELPFRAESFDTVLGLSMLTYLPEPQRMIAEAWRVLPKGGMLVLDFTQTLPPGEPLHSYFRFTPHDARSMLERAGFEVVEVFPVGGPWTHVAMSLMVPLNRLNRGPQRVLTELPVRALYILIQLSCALLDRMFGNRNAALAHLFVAHRIERPEPPR